MLVLGVLPGVVLAVVLSLFWLLATAMRPKDAILGRLPGLSGFHSIADYPQAETIPGLLLYRFSANLLFFNIDYFCERVRAAIRHAASPVAWVIVDLSPTSFVDATAVQRFDELRQELEARGIRLGTVHAKRQLGANFEKRWVAERHAAEVLAFPTLRSRGSGVRGSFGTAPDRRSWCRLRCGDPGRPRRRGPDCSGDRYAA